jgi:antitoxin CptB
LLGIETGTGQMSELNDAERRKRLKFRAWHRGMKEVDLILGRFADASVDGMDASGLAAFETLLEEPDPVILAWVTGGEAPSAERSTPLLRRLIEFHR